MEDRFTCALSTIKLYIIYGHIGLLIGASSSLKDDLQPTDFELNVLATYQKVEASLDLDSSGPDLEHSSGCELHLSQMPHISLVIGHPPNIMSQIVLDQVHVEAHRIG